MGGERYMKYLPPMMADLTELQQLGNVENGILADMEKAKCDVEANQWIQTATRKGLLRRADMMGLQQLQKEDTETLRGLVLARWNNHSPYTWWTFCHWLDMYCGEGNYQVAMDNAKYHLHITLELSQKQKQQDILLFWKDLIPANILFSVELNKNTHADVAVMTYGGLKAGKWLHGEIPFVDFSVYEKI